MEDITKFHDVLADLRKAKPGSEERSRIVESCLQARAIVPSLAVFTCWLQEDVYAIQSAPPRMRARKAVLALVSLARLRCLGSVAATFLSPPSASGALRSAILESDLIDWRLFKSGLDQIDDAELEREYGSWVLRAIQKHQYPVPFETVSTSRKFVYELAIRKA